MKIKLAFMVAAFVVLIGNGAEAQASGLMGEGFSANGAPRLILVKSDHWCKQHPGKCHHRHHRHHRHNAPFSPPYGNAWGKRDGFCHQHPNTGQCQKLCDFNGRNCHLR